MYVASDKCPTRIISSLLDIFCIIWQRAQIVKFYAYFSPAPFTSFLLDLNIALLILCQALWNYVVLLDKYLWFQNT
jgi:hypothetical protein